MRLSSRPALPAGLRDFFGAEPSELQLPLNTWQTLTVSVKGPDVAASAHGGKLTVKHTLPAPVSGRVGVWTKNDSVTSFRDYMVTDKQFEKAGLSQKAEVRSQK